AGECGADFQDAATVQAEEGNHSAFRECQGHLRTVEPVSIIDSWQIASSVHDFASLGHTQGFGPSAGERLPPSVLAQQKSVQKKCRKDGALRTRIETTSKRFEAGSGHFYGPDTRCRAGFS